MAHCFNVNPNPPTPPTNNTCHVLSQMQRIDWTTTEISPGLEARFGNMTVDYSYTWRGFDTNDESVYRIYNHFTGFTGPVNNSNSVPIELGIVPEDLTQMHKVKIGWVVNDCNNVYANLMYGATDSFLRDLHRWFDNVDLRWTNRAIEGVSYTLYGVYYSDRNSTPVVMGPPLYPGETAIDLRHPVDHAESRGGIRGNWRPFDDEDLSLVGRYEYDLMERNFATYPFNDQTSTFTQPDTRTNTVEFGPEMRWSSQNKSYVRYRGNFVENPLVGVSPYSQVSPLASALHTKQAEQEHRIELGHVWMPSTNFIVTSQVSLVERLNNTYFFNEQDYPFYLNLWYAPTDRLNLSAGYAYFSNAISQNMTLGDNVGTATNVQTETNRFGYAGIANVLSLSGTYAINALWALTAGYEYMRGSNTFNVAPSPVPGVDWSLLPSLSDVIVETNRVTAGVDYKPSKHTDVYFRYIFYGYNDISSGLDTGTANMFLAGASVLW